MQIRNIWGCCDTYKFFVGFQRNLDNFEVLVLLLVYIVIAVFCDYWWDDKVSHVCKLGIAGRDTDMLDIEYLNGDWCRQIKYCLVVPLSEK